MGRGALSQGWLSRLPRPAFPASSLPAASLLHLVLLWVSFPRGAPPPASLSSHQPHVCDEVPETEPFPRGLKENAGPILTSVHCFLSAYGKACRHHSKSTQLPSVC